MSMTIEVQLVNSGSRAAPREGRRLRAFLRNPTFVAGVVILGFFVLALFAGLLFRRSAGHGGRAALLAGRELGVPLGTDQLGRNVLAMLAYGARLAAGRHLSAAIGLAMLVVGATPASWRPGRYLPDAAGRAVQTTPALLVI